LAFQLKPKVKFFFCFFYHWCFFRSNISHSL
jgi:hypothetical protein